MTEGVQPCDVVARKVKDSFPVNSMNFSNVWMKVGQVMSTDVLTIFPDKTVAFAAMQMSINDVSCVIVIDDEDVIGILTETDILNRTIAQNKNALKTTVVEVMSSPVQAARAELSILDASRMMETKRIKRLPIINEGQLVGIVTQTDLTRIMNYYGTWKDVSEIMSSDVISVQKGTSVAEAAKLMTSRRISAVIVVSENRAVGILTERDMLKRVIALQKNPNHLKVEKIMSSPVVRVPASFSVFAASKTMESMRIRRLLVMQDDQLEGIVTQTDIFMAVKNKLLTEEQKNLQLLENSKSPIYIEDTGHVITYVNLAFAELFKVEDRNEFIGQPLIAERFWMNPADRIEFIEELSKGSFQSNELALKTVTGDKIYVTIFSHFTTSARGEINGWQGILYDVTAKKELTALRIAEKALRQSEQKWRLLAENIPDILLTVDKDGKIRFLNYAMNGLEPEDVIGTEIYDYVKPEQRKKLKDAVEQAFQTSSPQECDIRGDGGFGPQMWLEIRVIPVLIDGQVIAVNLICTDITQRKESEKKQADLMRQIESVNQELKEFAYTVSHDLKAPLRGINTLANWISEDYSDKLDNQGKEHLYLLMKRVDKMHNLIEGILQYSRVGRFDKQTESIDLNELLPEVIDMVSLPDNIDITIENELPVIEFERTRIGQVFQNLLSNAVKYMDKPHGRIRIDCQRQDNCWQFRVVDNGPGIKQEHFERIFQMFQTLVTPDEFESTGIGLTLVKRIIETYGGNIWIESEVGEGSQFFFTVPKHNKDIELEDDKLTTLCR